MLALTLAACGSDSEPATEVADRLTTPTKAETSPTTTTDTAAEQRAQARRDAQARRAARKRAEAKRRQREQAREERRAERERRAEERRQKAAAEQAAAEEAARQKAAEEAAARDQAAQTKPAGPVAHAVTETANLQLVSKQGTAFVQEGSVTGTLAGTMRLDAKLGGKGVVGTFTVTLDDGTLTGSASAALTLAGPRANFKGTAQISKGTGAYARLQPAQVAFSGSVKSDASSSTVKLSGTLTW